MSVISLTYNRKGSLSWLLCALQQQDYPIVELIVVDNASSDGTPEMVRAEFPGVRLVQSPENRGNYSYSLGIAVANGEFLILIDDDGLPARLDWISQIVRRFRDNSRLGAAACTIRMQDSGRLAPDSPQFLPLGSSEIGYPCAAYNGTGVGLRASAVRLLTPIYPEGYFHAYVELHSTTRLLMAGWDVRIFPEIEVWHCRASGTSDPPCSYYGLRNYFWYVWTFYPWPYWLTESLHELGSRIKLAMQGKIPVGRLLRAWRSALGDRRDALRERQPMDRYLLEYLRSLRRCGNGHGLAPALRSFSDAGRGTVGMDKV